VEVSERIARQRAWRLSHLSALDLGICDVLARLRVVSRLAGIRGLVLGVRPGVDARHVVGAHCGARTRKA